jgi:hypothetical protein
MPILGTIASQVPGKISVGAFESIATATPSGTSVTFSSIPQTFTHLQVRAISRTTRNDASVDGMYMRFNGDANGNYSYHWVQGNGSSASVVSGTNTTVITAAFNGADAQTTANVFSNSVWDVLDYTNTNKYKTTKSVFAYNADGGVGTVSLGSGNWRNTAAITSIPLFAEGNFVANSHFGLYGIKGA